MQIIVVTRSPSLRTSPSALAVVEERERRRLCVGNAAENDSRCFGLFELDACLSDPRFVTGHTPNSDLPLHQNTEPEPEPSFRNGLRALITSIFVRVCFSALNKSREWCLTAGGTGWVWDGAVVSAASMKDVREVLSTLYSSKNTESSGGLESYGYAAI